MTAIRVRKRPVEVDAIRWTGDNEDDVAEFAMAERSVMTRFAALDEADRSNCDDPEATAQVFDDLHSTWVLVYTGDYIIRGVQGEFYPIRPDVFAATYEPVGGGHDYLSTACLHGKHGYCSQARGIHGNKIPAQCKFCPAPCRCDCHTKADTE